MPPPFSFPDRSDGQVYTAAMVNAVQDAVEEIGTLGVQNASAAAITGGTVAAVLSDTGGQVFNAAAYGAVGDCKRVTDAAMTAASTTLTSATAAFVAGDVGKLIGVYGAGAAGVALRTTIATRVSATEVTLAVAASTTVSGKTAVWGTDNRAAIQAAHEAGWLDSSGNGMVVFLPRGNYLVGPHPTLEASNISLILKSRMTYAGAGRSATTITLAPGCNCHVISCEASTISPTVQDLTLDGTGPSHTLAVTGLRFNTTTGGTARRVRVTAAMHYGISDQGLNKDTVLEDIEVDNCVDPTNGSGDGLDFKRSIRCSVNRAYIHDNGAGHAADMRGQWLILRDVRAIDNGGVGIALRMTAHNTDVGFEEKAHIIADGLVADGNGTHGIWVEAVDPAGDGAGSPDPWKGRVLLTNCFSRDNGQNGFYLEGERCYWHVVNCWASGNTQDGFDLNANNVVDWQGKIVNCTAYQNTLAGFDLSRANGREASLVACEAIDNTSYGFHVGGSRHRLIGCRASDNDNHGVFVLSAAADCVIDTGAFSAVGGKTAVQIEGDRTQVIGSAFSGAGSGVVIAATADATRVTACALNAVSGTKLTNSGTNTKLLNNEGVTDIDVYHDPVNSSFEYDDFPSGTGTSTQIGKFGWVATAGAVSVPFAVAGHPGLILLSTGTGAGTYVNMRASTNTTTGPLSAGDTFDVTWIVRLNTNDADTTARVGLGTSPAADPPDEGIYFEKLGADTNWFRVTRSAAIQTRNDTGVAASTDWIRFRLRRIDASTIGFSVNGGAEGTHTTNVPAAGVNPFVAIYNNAAAANKTITIDWFSQLITGMTR
jgi:hypothetical protein